jgi:GNAT superfamily N-acetyltransferase
MFVAFYRGEPVAMQAVIASPHPGRKGVYRGHRAVCLPDYQGVGIGNALITYIASAYWGLGFRILSTTASPALIATRSRDTERWRCLAKPHLCQPFSKSSGKGFNKWTPAINRLTSTWEYIGAPMDEGEARQLVYGCGSGSCPMAGGSKGVIQAEA